MLTTIDNKQADARDYETQSGPGSTSPSTTSTAPDAALVYLQQHKREATLSLIHDEKYMRRLRRKVDYRVIPLLTCCYIMNFLDKVILNVMSTLGPARTQSD